MTREQQTAYEWAKNQNYSSVAARYSKQLTEVIDEQSKQLEKYHHAEQWIADINNPLEPIKVSSALNSEIFKYQFRKEHKPQDISELDVTIIAALVDVLKRSKEANHAK